MPFPLKPFLVRGAIWLGAALLILILLILLFFLLIQTDMAKKKMTAMISKAVSRDGLQVDIQGLDGWIPFRISADAVKVSDVRGEFLEVRNLRFSWEPFSLINRPLTITEAKASSIRLDRIPDIPPEPETKKKDTSFSMPEMVLETLAVSNLHLAGAVLGQPADFTFTAQAESGGNRNLKAGLTLRQTDKPGTLLEMALDSRGDPPVLDLDARLEEKEDGLLHLLLGINGKGPLQARISGKGALSQWPGRLSAELQTVGTLSADIRMAISDRVGLKSDGRVQFAEGVLPQSLSSVLEGNATDFHLVLDLGEAKNLFPENMEFSASGIDARLASVSRKEEEYAGLFHLKVVDLSLFSGLAGTDVSGGLDIEGSFSGIPAQPKLELKADLDHPQWKEFSASALGVDLSLAGLEDGTLSEPHIQVNIKGRAADLRQKDKGKIILRDPFEFRIRSGIERISDAWQIDPLRLEMEGHRMDFSGRIAADFSEIKGKLTADLTDPGNLFADFPEKIKGNLQVSADINGNLKKQSLSAEITGVLRSVKGVHPRFDSLSASATNLAGTVQFTANEQVAVDGLSIRSDWADLTGGGRLNLRTREMTGSFKARLPRLEMMSTAAGMPLEGSLDLETKLDGTISDPSVQAGFQSGFLSVRGRSFRQIDGNVNARGIRTAPAGDFRIDLIAEGQNLKAGGNFRREGQWLDISDLAIQAAEGKIDGRMRIAFEGPALEGNLSGEKLSLDALSPFLGRSLSGKVGFTADFSRAENEQQIGFAVRGREISSEFGNIRNVTVTGALQDVFDSPRIDGTLESAGLSRENLKLSSLSIHLKGVPENAAFQLRTKGELSGKPVSLSTGGVYQKENPESFEVRLTDFSGNIQDHRFSLDDPMVVAKTGPEITIAPFRLRLGTGQIFGSGKFALNGIRADVSLRAFPMEGLEAFGLPAFQGSADGKIDLSGTAEQPVADFNLLVRDLRLMIAAGTDRPPVRIEGTGGYSGGRLQAVLTASGIKDTQVKADLMIPMRVNLNPSDFQLAPASDMQGRLTARVALEQLPAIFYLENQLPAGRFSADLDVGGPMNAPEISGRMEIENGRYEHLAHGLVVEGADISARMEKGEIILEKATATDGENGRLAMTGKMALDAGSHFPMDLSLGLEKCVLIRRPDLTAGADGNLNVSGDLRELTVAGQLTLDPAQYNLPRERTAKIQVLDVKEINHPDQEKEAEKAKKSAGETVLKLDIGLRSPGQAFIRGRGLSSEWKGDLRVTGPAARPTLTGRLSLVQGRYVFFDKPFDLTQGLIRFSGTSPPLPNFTVTAEHQRQDLLVRIRVSGTPRQLDVELTSEPVLPKDEVLSQLLFGQGVADITPLQALRLAEAIGSLAGVRGTGITNFVENTRRVIGVDELSVSPNEEGETTVRIGKYIGEDIFVQLEKGFGPEEQGGVSVEVRISSNLTLESEAGAGGEGGAILNWRWDY